MKLNVRTLVLTKQQYLQYARLYDDLTTAEKRIADARTFKETGLQWRSPRWVYDRRDGCVLGDDIEGDIEYCL